MTMDHARTTARPTTGDRRADFVELPAREVRRNPPTRSGRWGEGTRAEKRRKWRARPSDSAPGGLLLAERSRRAQSGNAPKRAERYTRRGSRPLPGERE